MTHHAISNLNPWPIRAEFRKNDFWKHLLQRNQALTDGGFNFHRLMVRPAAMETFAHYLAHQLYGKISHPPFVVLGKASEAFAVYALASKLGAFPALVDKGVIPITFLDNIPKFATALPLLGVAQSLDDYQPLFDAAAGFSEGRITASYIWNNPTIPTSDRHVTVAQIV